MTFAVTVVFESTILFIFFTLTKDVELAAYAGLYPDQSLMISGAFLFVTEALYVADAINLLRSCVLQRYWLERLLIFWTLWIGDNFFFCLFFNLVKEKVLELHLQLSYLLGLAVNSLLALLNMTFLSYNCFGLLL